VSDGDGLRREQAADNAKRGAGKRDQPSLSLPKGGGAIRGLGEKATANPVTGTASVSVPVSLSAGRGAVAPQLVLSYDSGAGNGPFGLGWSIDLPSVSRRTDQGVPRYDDSDVFQLTGAEDLVPALQRDANGDWVPVTRTVGEFDVEAYRPRTEGAFARIERWRDRVSADTHWRVTSRDNVLSVYGRDPSARIGDPADPRRVLRWLLEETADDRGNIVRYGYKPEDGVGVDTGAPQEWNRYREGTGLANRYLKRIRYSNARPDVAEDFAFEVVFDYGEHDTSPAETAVWSTRLDPFSSYRSGFEVRTYRLCRRILMFHRFAELGAEPVLAQSTDLDYRPGSALTVLERIRQRGYTLVEGRYESKSLPALDFGYSQRSVSAASRLFTTAPGEPPPRSSPDGYRWVDLDGEGIMGVLAEQGGAWHYRSNLGGGVLDGPHPVAPLPATASLAVGQQLLDIAGDGGTALVDFAGTAPGFYRRTIDGWADFSPFATLPMVPFDDPNLRLVDLTGDGLSDVLLTADDGLTWHPSTGTTGFGAAEQVATPKDDERGPRVVFADAEQSVYLADMTGDGLTDLVRIRNGEVCYWPNLGRGRFGAKVTMAGAAVFDTPDRFDQRRVRLFDVDGSAPADLLYLGPEGVRVWFNQAGNSWSAPEDVDAVFPAHVVAEVGVADVLGKGTACLVIAEDRPDGEPQLRYLDLMAEGKPHLLRRIDNGMGLITQFRYESSTAYYLSDKAAGRPWVTRLPFPVLVVAQIAVHDTVAATDLVSTYRYRHGYYDGVEREFRGFGYVEQHDALILTSSEMESELFQPPAVSKRWQHTGWYAGRDAVSRQFAGEYWPGAGLLLPDTVLPEGLTAGEEREACRALRGLVLREEVTAEDGGPLRDEPYQVTEHSYQLRLVQARAGTRHAAFFPHSEQTLTVHTERSTDDPRVTHELTLRVDDWGNVLRSAQVAYPRRAAGDGEQKRLRITCTDHDTVNQVGQAGPWRVGTPVESRGYEAGGVSPQGMVFDSTELDAAFEATTEIPHQEELSGVQPQRRLITRQRLAYYADDLQSELPLGEVGLRALLYRTYQQAFADGHAAVLYGDRVDDTLLAEAGYLRFPAEPVWWAPSDRQVFDAGHFYLPSSIVDQFGYLTRVDYDPHYLVPTRITDPLDNVTTALVDYRVLQPWQLTEPNGNTSAVRFDELGMVVATAVSGKRGEGDVLGPSPDTATTRLEYDLAVVPVRFHTLARQQHGPANRRWQESWTYCDGTGRTILTKVQAEPAEGDDRPRWVGTGRTIHDNKGNPVKQYEPYFAPDSGFDTEAELVRTGVTPILRYDPLGRLVRTEFPDGTEAMVVFNAWEQQDWDRNDTVTSTRWYTERSALPETDPRHRAAELAAAHAATFAETRFDTLGRAHVTIADNGNDPAGNPVLFRTTVDRDIQGNELAVTDARGVRVVEQRFDMLGRPAYTRSPDAGQRWSLTDVLGKPVRAWDGRGTALRWHYDGLRRATHAFASTAGGAETLRTRQFYGEAADGGAERNLRGRPYLVFDGAGLVRTVEVDFKGNLLATERRLTVDATGEPDWSTVAEVTDPDEAVRLAARVLERTAFTTRTEYDALNRPTSITSPDGSVTLPVYNEANLLERLEIRVRGAAEPTPFVTDIDYNARGQRTLLVQGSGAETRYEYEADTFRLATVGTKSSDGRVLQALDYTYDPVGNVVETDDKAQPTLFFANAVVPTARRYTYDPTYRLRSATGREHIGQALNEQPGPVDPPHANDQAAMRAYTEHYDYDEAGNILQLAHTADGGSWTRRHWVAPDSNRLLANSIPGDASGTFSARYTYDVNGNVISMPHLSRMDWDAENRLVEIDRGGGGAVRYQYDAAGQRVRTTVVRNGTTDTRIYLGQTEIYRRTVAGTVRLERETLHVLDRAQRIAIVETTTVDTRLVSDPKPVVRYQLADHIGSSVVELSDTAAVLSYEEYHPFGTTSFHSARGAAEVSTKRYRFTGKEKDAETGFYYHGARYYASWLARWTAPDPSGLVDGPNRYSYVRNNPIGLSDPTGRQSDNENDTDSARPPGSSLPVPPQGSQAGPAARPRSQATINRQEGLGAADNVKTVIERPGHGLKTEVTVKPGQGGSRIDIVPDPAAPQSIAKTIESKQLDLDAYRAADGSLDTRRLAGVIDDNVAQVIKHENALRTTSKADLPAREALVYTLKNARDAEATLFERLFRGIASPQGVKGGVLQMRDGVLQTASGKPLLDTKLPAPAPTLGAWGIGAAGVSVFSGFLGYQAGLQQESRIAGTAQSTAGALELTGGLLYAYGVAIGDAGLVALGVEATTLGGGAGIIIGGGAAIGNGLARLNYNSGKLVNAAIAAIDPRKASQPYVPPRPVTIGELVTSWLK
jgi:RHS repeat-associated protein